MAFPGAKRLKALLLRPEFSYRLYLKMTFGAGSLTEKPAAMAMNGALKNRATWEAADAMGRRMHLPLHRDPAKNWDHLAAVSAILASTAPDARILDAGAELYSNVLPALFLYGYRNLYGINLDFKSTTRRGPIEYRRGDLTQTPFPDGYFDAVTCMSVIEHGVPIEAYFREMYRVLKPGGLLITSTDYFPTPIDTRGQTAHGAPIKIFSKRDILDLLQIAERAGFQQTGDIDLDCTEKPIRWEQYGLEYTFLLFTLRRVP